MIYIKYIVLAISSCILTLIAIVFAPIICLSVKDNQLPAWLSWFGTPDNPATGDPSFWPQQHPTYSPYQLAVTWMWRNPAQGFDRFAKADISYNTMLDVRGNINIDDSTKPPIGGWLFITGGGYFQFSSIIPTRFGCLVTHLGWNIDPIAKGYQHPTFGALKATPLRFYKAK